MGRRTYPKKWLQTEESALPVASMTVFYDPADASQSLLEPGFTWISLTFLGVGLLGLLLIDWIFFKKFGA